MKCPGQDRAFWKPEDVCDIPCPGCGTRVEFMKDDFVRKCPNCGFRFGKPQGEGDCTEWCPAADKCLGLARGTIARRKAGTGE